MSKQEEEIYNILKLILPDIKREVTFDKITGVLIHKSLRVDFYSKEFNIVCECHGVQHHKASGFSGSKIKALSSFASQATRDDRLIRICKDFNINYEQIDYTEDITFFSMYQKFSKYLEAKDA